MKYVCKAETHLNCHSISPCLTSLYFQKSRISFQSSVKIRFPDHFICEENFHAMELLVASPTFFYLDVGAHDKKIEHTKKLPHQLSKRHV
ncbi:hypothetical protein IEQ34_012516 [Dendrobium chrysotoxum]|uniref:Uncharacterized protein n=1 Tax=Dendrobium chrysotoxum TaxID=161865 RepID=A0AAV7GTH3_DENCH|nr:hypothetical protein IEQ34_012516 [Dendrobium chrysotoxum]